jgi:hypothetical protein
VQPCFLYYNVKAGEQQLFAAAAALWEATGEAAYRTDVDKWFAYYSQARPYTGFLFLQARLRALSRTFRRPSDSLARLVPLQGGSRGLAGGRCVHLTA